MRLLSRIPSLVLVLVLALALSSCQRVYPVRTLPTWVRGIYVPMVQNRSTEPGIEEIATLQTQEQFLADGRVGVVKKARADLQLVAVVRSYRVIVEDTDNDDVPRREIIQILTDVSLHDPLIDPFDPPEDPVANLGQILTEYPYNSDPRSIAFEIEPDAKKAALGVLARQIVNETITGFPVDLRGGDADLKLPQIQAPGQSIEGDIFRQRSRRYD